MDKSGGPPKRKKRVLEKEPIPPKPPQPKVRSYSPRIVVMSCVLSSARILPPYHRLNGPNITTTRPTQIRRPMSLLLHRYHMRLTVMVGAIITTTLIMVRQVAQSQTKPFFSTASRSLSMTRPHIKTFSGFSTCSRRRLLTFGC